jgi:hypothetical protein
VTILPGVPVAAGISLELLDPKEPGSLKGTVANETGIDTSRVMVAMFEKSDSTRAAYRALSDSTGAYEIKSVKPGEYILRAFVDVKADSMFGVYPCPPKPAGCPEPSTRRPGELRMKAGAALIEPILVIRRKEGP